LGSCCPVTNILSQDLQAGKGPSISDSDSVILKSKMYQLINGSADPVEGGDSVVTCKSLSDLKSKPWYSGMLSMKIGGERVIIFPSKVSINQ